MDRSGASKTLDVDPGSAGWQHIEIRGCKHTDRAGPTGMAELTQGERKEESDSGKQGYPPWLHCGWVCRADSLLEARGGELRGGRRELVQRLTFHALTVPTSERGPTSVSPLTNQICNIFLSRGVWRGLGRTPEVGLPWGEGQTSPRPRKMSQALTAAVTVIRAKSAQNIEVKDVHFNWEVKKVSWKACP